MYEHAHMHICPEARCYTAKCSGSVQGASPCTLASLRVREPVLHARGLQAGTDFPLFLSFASPHPQAG
eukprot:1161611-Pelagomonas_calceolata.AAC.6